MYDINNILFEDNHLIAVNKPAGALAQGDATGDDPIGEYVKKYIKEKYQKPGKVFLGVPHRLDRPVSGVLLLARTSKALSRITQLFQKREIQKEYWALTEIKPKQERETLIHWLRKDNRKNITTAFNIETEGTKKAELDYILAGAVDGIYFLKVYPKTGRPHQIRVQLASMGCPIIGDLKYGANSVNKDASICLHARTLSFIHPVKKSPVTITAPLPELSIWDSFRV